MFNIQHAKFSNNGYAAIIKNLDLNTGDDVLKQSKVVYTNDRTGTISEHVAKGSQLYTLVLIWYHAQGLNPADYVRGFHADKNGNGFRWHHGAGYDIYGDLFDTIELVNGNDTKNGVDESLNYVRKFLEYESDPELQHREIINDKLAVLSDGRDGLLRRHLSTPFIYDYLKENDLIPDADNYLSINTYMVDFKTSNANSVVNYGAKEFAKWCLFSKLVYNDPNDHNGGVSKVMKHANDILINPDGINGPEIVSRGDLLNFINQTAAEIETLK